MKILRASQLREMMDHRPNVLLINALERDAYDREHIPGSFSIPVTTPDMEGQTDLLAAGVRDRPVVTYCAGTQCGASYEAAKKLEDAGFSEVYHFPGGMSAWKAEHYPVQGSRRRRPMAQDAA